MVHLRALPGAPLFGGSLDEVIEAAMADANALAAGGCDGIVFENFGDRPFHKRVGPETVAAMTRVITEVRPKLPFGVNVLRNDARAALAIAAATGAQFIRVNVHVGVMATDQGIIEGEAAETLRLRTPHVLIFADYLVKHATPIDGGSGRRSNSRTICTTRSASATFFRFSWASDSPSVNVSWEALGRSDSFGGSAPQDARPEHDNRTVEKRESRRLAGHFGGDA